MNVTQAIAHARSVISVHGTHTNWIVIGPYAGIDGPYTEARRSSYAAASRLAADWKYQIALMALGCSSDDAFFASEDRFGPWEPLVRRYAKEKRVASMA
jgi:hypothetical protein